MGPLRVSAANPRYLTDGSGRPIYLAGFHTWYSAQDGGNTDPPAPLDWAEYLNALVSYGCNFTKLWAMETGRGWSDATNQWFLPTRYVRTGPGNDNDGKLKFDLTKINPDYLDRLYRRAVDCGQRGIYVCVQLFQGWQIEDKGMAGDPWRYHPYELVNNINSVDGDQDNDGQGTETHYDTGANIVLSYQRTLVEAIINKLNGLDNVIYEISNEDFPSAANTGWQRDMVDYIHTHEASKPYRHPVGLTTQYPGDSDMMDLSNAEWCCYDGGKANSTHPASDPVSFYDTDHVVGLTSNYPWIWESLCNGHGGAWYMDEWDGALYGGDTRNNATYQLIRSNLGYALTQFKLLKNPLLMTPQPGLCSTGFCLARNHSTEAEYVCFQGGSGSFTLNLSTATGTLNIRWLRCSAGTVSTDTVSGGAIRTLMPPATGAHIVYVYH